ncbi:MAG: two component transcriptional regulator, winged helix family [Candidatus Eremiobacteraeota bacterium]|nr:two component transcriptional regulator, winged helix family [Candidatus Eremiobacteraeota bacterium]
MDGPAASVLVIDDELHTRDVLEIGLMQRGFRVRTAADGAAGLKLLGAERFDVILLDLMLPKADGLALIPLLRRSTEAPIVMLSAKADVSAKVTGLEAGADDYLAKPFDFGELAARLRSALRRPALRELDLLRYADLSIDVQRRRVERSGEQIRLTAREFDLLALLVRSPERVYTRSQLIDLVWGAERGVTPATVESYISYLRAKVDVAPRRRLIHTIRGVGYSVR